MRRSRKFPRNFIRRDLCWSWEEASTSPHVWREPSRWRSWPTCTRRGSRLGSWSTAPWPWWTPPSPYWWSWWGTLSSPSVWTLSSRSLPGMENPFSSLRWARIYSFFSTTSIIRKETRRPVKVQNMPLRCQKQLMPSKEFWRWFLFSCCPITSLSSEAAMWTAQETWQSLSLWNRGVMNVLTMK